MKRTYNSDQKRRNITTDDTTWARLKEIGNGNASEGIRILTKLYTPESLHKPQ